MPIRIGIIGMGFMGRTHYEAYQKIPDAQVTMIADRNPKRAAGDVRSEWGNLGTGDIRQIPMDVIRGVTDWRRLVDDPQVDVVDICSATPVHVEYSLAALAAGKHVLCEKPLATSSAQARVLLDASRKSEGFFMPAMCLRFWPEWQWLKRAVENQIYGPVRSAVFRRLGSMPGAWFRDGALSGGALFDLHVHDADFIYHLFGRPKAVYARGYSLEARRIDHLMVQYIYDDQKLVAAEGGWSLADGWEFDATYTVNFESATADYQRVRQPALRVCEQGKCEPVLLDEPDGFVGELSYFLECVKRGERPTRITIEDAVNCLAMIEAEKASIVSGNIVAVGQ
jgi:predicted dehydrogenase